MTALAIQHRVQILERVANGELLDQIAQSYGIAAPNVSKHLAQDPEYRQARMLGAELRLERAYQAIEDVAALGTDQDGTIIGVNANMGNLARIRYDSLKAAQWFAEREFPERWGQRTQVSLSGSLGELITQVSQRQLEHVIDAEVLPADTPPAHNPTDTST